MGEFVWAARDTREETQNETKTTTKSINENNNNKIATISLGKSNYLDNDYANTHFENQSILEEEEEKKNHYLVALNDDNNETEMEGEEWESDGNSKTEHSRAIFPHVHADESRCRRRPRL